MEKDIWIKKVMESASEWKDLAPTDGSWLPLQKERFGLKNTLFTKKQLMGIAASILVLLSVNLSLVIQHYKILDSEEKSALIEQFDSRSDETYLY